MKKLLLILLIPSGLAVGQTLDKLDTAMVSKFKDEGMKRSKVMEILSMLTDVNGPRLTNSPGYKKAAEYAKKSLESWGVQNVTFDTWTEQEPFGRGWQLKKFNLQTVSPYYFPLTAYPKAWSPGVKGTVQADVVYLDVQKEEDIQAYKGKLKGKFILFSLPAPIKLGFKPDATRLTDSTLLVMANSGASQAFGGRRFSAPAQPQRLAYLKWMLCQEEGALAVLEPGLRFEDGTYVVAGATVPYPAETPFSKRKAVYKPDAPKILPQVVIGSEHYNQLIRQIKQGQNVKLELVLETEFTPAAPGFNVIGEIPGTDLKDEIVMIGAHLDSWHSATGTTDNAAGSAVMLEVMRILKALDVSPRRTIRIALWGGEEQGLIGSASYVKRTFGERLDKSFPYDSIQLKPAAQNFSVYFNMDNGSGKFRGVYLQGNEKIAPIFREWLKPFNKMGASTLTLQNTGGTDHLSFDAIGLPGFQFIQDPLEYGTRTHHTSLDLYDKAVEADMKQNAVMVATFAWQAANYSEKMPRK